ncbi:hypothetical protein OSB04_016139 [Centaurea solstitialis]|uniref:GAG-pre-integrase domain-containing protein n=1 Tax=Centaurea solstitialis TaxID=347529 RepID=A0AA38WJE8_9ASTR|nr:hypothetical protein OSB04_016139 [Centaurea solstitialis]
MMTHTSAQVRGNHSRGGCTRGGRSNNNGSRRPPRCLLCGREHYADKCHHVQIVPCNPPNTVANLVEAFNAICFISSITAFNWYIDTGAPAHMTSSPSSLDFYMPYTGRRDNGLYALEQGTSALVAVLTSKRLCASFELWHSRLVGIINCYVVITQTFTLFVLSACKKQTFVFLTSKRLCASFESWHLRLGHVAFDTTSFLNKLGLTVTSLLPKLSLCSSCQLAKSKHLSFKVNHKRASHVLDLVHCDLAGPSPVYVISMDDFSCFTWMYPLHVWFPIKMFQSIGGTEFTNKKVQQFLQEKGTHHCSRVHTLQLKMNRLGANIDISPKLIWPCYSIHMRAAASLWVDAFTSAA